VIRKIDPDRARAEIEKLDMFFQGVDISRPEVQSSSIEYEVRQVKEALPRQKREATAKGAITSETMAELYIKQGFTDRALKIYQDILIAYPDRHDIKEKIRELDQGIEPDVKRPEKRPSRTVEIEAPDEMTEPRLPWEDEQSGEVPRVAAKTAMDMLKEESAAREESTARTEEAVMELPFVQSSEAPPPDTALDKTARDKKETERRKLT